jgi:fluoroquinolone transport system ATP-binding protein
VTENDIVIRVEGLTYTYPGTHSPAVRGISFEVQRGEVLGFLGPSGAGKSTTQKILIQLLRDYEGSAEVFGRDLTAWASDYRERIGVSFEMPSNYQKLTAHENLCLFAALYSGATEDPMTLLEMVGLAEDAHTRLSQYSKGMQMRLNFARSLLNRPELLFLDEPTVGIDPVNSRRIKDIISDQRSNGRTVFLTTHDMTVADQLSDRVAFIVDGRIAATDSPRNLKLEHGRQSVRVEYRQEGQLQRRDFPLDDTTGGSGLQDLLGDDVQVETIHTQEATLEDIFIRVTGKELV